MAELSLKARCPAFGSQPQAALFTRLLIDHPDICACPLPAHLPGAKLGVEAAFARPPPLGVGVKARWLFYTVGMRHSSCFIFQFPPRPNMRLNWGFTVRDFTFQTSAFAICLGFSVANLPPPLRRGHCLRLLCWSSPLLTFPSLVSQRVRSILKDSFLWELGGTHLGGE